MRSRVFWPIVLILIGVLFLLGNLGILPGSAWGWFLALLLLFLGASLFLGALRARSPQGGPRAAVVQRSAPLEGASLAAVNLKHGAGRLSLGAGAEPGLLFSGNFAGGLDLQLQRSGDLLDATLRVPPQDWSLYMWPWNWWGWQRGLDWEVALNAEIPLALTLEVGAAESRLDLSGLRVTDLVLNTGASATAIVLPARAGQTRARIQCGAASVDVRVPEGVALRIRGRLGLGTTDVDTQRFPPAGGGYESEGFASAANRVDLELEGGLGSVKVW